MNDKTNGQKALEGVLNALVTIGVIFAAFISAILGLAKNS